MSAGRPSRVVSLLPPVGPSLPMVSTGLPSLVYLKMALSLAALPAIHTKPALSTWMPCSLATHGVVCGEAPALDEGAVGVELHDRRRRGAALVARRRQRRALLVVGERARPLQQPDVVVGTDRDARHLAQQPVVGQRLGPERIDLELRRIGGDGGRGKRDSTQQGGQRPDTPRFIVSSVVLVVMRPLPGSPSSPASRSGCRGHGSARDPCRAPCPGPWPSAR